MKMTKINATTVRKPAAWTNESLDSLMEHQAGQAYVVRQFGGDVVADFAAKSSRTNCDSAEYEVFDDGSLLFTNNAEDVVAYDASDWANEHLTGFAGMRWSDDIDADGFVIDDMDRNLMIHLWGEDVAREHFERNGGIVG
jgi:hypothetical protein